MTEKRFKVINGVIYEYNYILQSWEETDIDKVCKMLNAIDIMFDKFSERLQK